MTSCVGWQLVPREWEVLEKALLQKDWLLRQIPTSWSPEEGEAQPLMPKHREDIVKEIWGMRTAVEETK